MLAITMKEKGIDDVLVMGGGVIPEDDIPGLKATGIAAVFTPGSPTTEIIEFIKNNLKRKD